MYDLLAIPINREFGLVTIAVLILVAVSYLFSLKTSDKK